VTEILSGDERKDRPVPTGPASTDRSTDESVEDVLTSLRDALSAISTAQKAGQLALDAALERLRDPAETEAPSAPRIVGVDRARGVKPSPKALPVRVHARDDTTNDPSPAGAPWLQPAPWNDPRAAPSPGPAPSGEGPAPRVASSDEQVSSTEVSAARPVRESVPRGMRQVFVGMQKRANELDRLESAESIQEYLWTYARDAGVRGMLLQEKGRALYAEDAFGFDNFAGDRKGRLRKVVIPFDPDGLFGAAAQDRALYSGPRPVKGIPVDLVLVMGKQAPDWCVVVPLPYRNRWGTFLYFDAAGSLVDALLEVESIARLAVLQLRAARYRQHQPADRIRSFRAATLRERKRKKAARRGSLAEGSGSAEASGSNVANDPLSKKRPNPAAALRQVPEPNRFDADGNLVRPLDGNEILARIGELPTMPHVAARLIGLLEDPETEIKQLQEILSTDQAISVRLLQIANSSLYGNMREAANISEAIVRLGFTAIRSWLLSTVTRQLFVGDGTNENTMRLWRQSVMTAMAAELIAARTGGMDPEIAFVGGLLQNIGLLVLARSHPEVFEEIDLRASAAQQSYVDLERRILGFDHADVGGILLQRWGLGTSLVSAVSSHHRVTTVRDDDDHFAAIIALAEEIALRLGEGPTEAREDDIADLDVATRLEVDSETILGVSDELARRALDGELFQS